MSDRCTVCDADLTETHACGDEYTETYDFDGFMLEPSDEDTINPWYVRITDADTGDVLINKTVGCEQDAELIVDQFCMSLRQYMVLEDGGLATNRFLEVEGIVPGGTMQCTFAIMFGIITGGN